MTATITIVNHVTLDGVMQAPAGPDEDRSGGFEHGGWAAARMDHVLGEYLAKDRAAASGERGMLFGRRTYERFFDFWPKQTDGNPFTDVLNRTTKYVASTTLAEPLAWEHSVLLAGDAAQTVSELKASTDAALTVLGSGVLGHTLLRNGLVDELLLTIHPIVLGPGLRLFPTDVPATTFELVETLPTSTGVIIARYRLA
jgi:dihydrofolate reductase